MLTLMIAAFRRPRPHTLRVAMLMLFHYYDAMLLLLLMFDVYYLLRHRHFFFASFIPLFREAPRLLPRYMIRRRHAAEGLHAYALILRRPAVCAARLTQFYVHTPAPAPRCEASADMRSDGAKEARSAPRTLCIPSKCRRERRAAAQRYAPAPDAK